MDMYRSDTDSQILDEIRQGCKEIRRCRGELLAVSGRHIVVAGKIVLECDELESAGIAVGDECTTTIRDSSLASNRAIVIVG